MRESTENRLSARQLAPDAPALVVGAVAVGLMLVWSVHDGGYDADTWYWGALLTLALLGSTVIGVRNRRAPSRPTTVAIVLLAAYVAWSYLTITWAGSRGDALAGSNRALLYLLLFTQFALLPWTSRAAFLALLAFALGTGAIAVALLTRMALDDHIKALFLAGRLTAPTGYFNSTASLFTIGALLAIALAAQPQAPRFLRGALVASAAACLQLALVVQSRGWLFTLPLVALVSILLVRNRLRVALAAVLPVAATLVPLHTLLSVYSPSRADVTHATIRAGRVSLAICGATLLLATLASWRRVTPRVTVSRTVRRVTGGCAAALAIGAVGVGTVAATHGHPLRFASRQWHGFTHEQSSSSGSHFGDAGSGRFDFWRVSLDAVSSHPLLGLGQDNFAEYYIRRRRTPEEPSWTHSVELRLLVHTGIVGFVIFGAFTVAALTAALRTRRRGTTSGSLAGVALLPWVAWMIHGSVDWFWEMPALTGPALGFLAMAGRISDGLGSRSGPAQPSFRRPSPAFRHIRGLALALGFSACAVALGFSYLSVREVSQATQALPSQPLRALKDLSIAATLNPFDANPARIAGTVALRTGRFAEAQRRFTQAVERDPGGWYGWFGAGLAASAVGNRKLARRDLTTAASINAKQPAVTTALRRITGPHPLTPEQALAMLVTIT